MYIGFIYCAESPSNKKYYGKSTKDLIHVKIRHSKKSKVHKQRHFYTAIKKYGIDGFQWNIVETHCHVHKNELDKKLNEREIFFIENNKTYLRDFGYNMTLGGDGGDTTTNHPNREKIIETRTKSNKGQKRSTEFKEKCKEIQKNRYLHTPLEKKKTGDDNFGTRPCIGTCPRLSYFIPLCRKFIFKDPSQPGSV